MSNTAIPSKFVKALKSYWQHRKLGLIKLTHTPLRTFIQWINIKYLREDWARTGIKYFQLELLLKLSCCITIEASIKFSSRMKAQTVQQKQSLYLVLFHHFHIFFSFRNRNKCKKPQTPHPAWRKPALHIYYRNLTVKVFIFQPPDENHCLNSLGNAFHHAIFKAQRQLMKSIHNS